ncbi:hypothetical protein [Roseimicrobium sp. ORNL1]|uniref:hypothetical protein n=1 Tax=Roseimicrobium sp. ORNL1 TaxID=2711231 RepID=UPI0013E124E4|nr:hypothetical protein [Roseimicrobium sp. ORNL1]QIF01162.1 hypothetical protein G5S37_06390 [Roseimicrobium sp. ORNL1]
MKDTSYFCVLYLQLTQRFLCDSSGNRMSKFEEHLNLLATISGLIAFLWIGLRSDLPKFCESWSTWRNGNERSHLWQALLLVGPYLLFACATLVLVTQEPDIVITHHVVKSIHSEQESIVVNEVGRPTIPLITDADHVQVTVHGAIVGPELRALRNRYGSTQICVYVLVSQPELKVQSDLIWLQSAERGVLDSAGKYEAKAYLGGKGIDSARNDDRFDLYLYIPKDQGLNFESENIFSGMQSLPPSLFLSDVLKVKIVRA